MGNKEIFYMFVNIAGISALLTGSRNGIGICAINTTVLFLTRTVRKAGLDI